MFGYHDPEQFDQFQDPGLDLHVIREEIPAQGMALFRNSECCSSSPGANSLLLEDAPLLSLACSSFEQF